MMGLFVDLKAFDTIDRKVLCETMRMRGIRGSLIKRVKKVLRETKNKVRAEGKTGKSFWTARRIRQGCLLSPILFNIIIPILPSISDLEKNGKEWGGGG